ncbi:hypothetical protein GCM10010277_80160 [Streptomyces longisporoflavus]|uniref:hypothetical protein n=1 Tax=Streptomyces longisporoflavus TaxID=28044 RepID=UPI00167DC499|nr:hypothetical protein [Streptomyces longisporoflavus]GGV69798.1 hypothetical protein GCM10010277_80160 [Streptomyces longisporoflavus]
MVKQWHASAPVPYSRSYATLPRAGDRTGNTRCALVLGSYTPLPGLLLPGGRRPRLACLHAEAKQVRGDSFRADPRIADPVRHAKTCAVGPGGVDLGVVGPEFTALHHQMREALTMKPLKKPGPARGSGRRPTCDHCS